MMICVNCNMQVARKEDYVGVKVHNLVLCKRCYSDPGGPWSER